MSRKLIDLNEPFRRLRDAGYNIDIHAAHLIARDIPYVNEHGKVAYDGILVTTLSMNGETANAPDTHKMMFAGSYPCQHDGKPLEVLRNETADARISDGLTVNHTFSMKVGGRAQYVDYYEKVHSYASAISGPAKVLDPEATPLTRRVCESEDEDSPFAYMDTASARAEINMVTRKLAVECVAIVGLGGTGSYVLDLLSKTPIKEIHIFDGDTFSSHNAFRAPGAISKEDLGKQPLKVEYFQGVYSRMHLKIIAHAEHIDAGNVGLLRNTSFVFLCAEAGKGKKHIVEKLEEFGVGFIDVGMGLFVKDESVGGILRVTTSLQENRDTARARIPFVAADHNDEYDKNIQIADLNCLNAVLAVMRWKKLRGFYVDRKQERFNAFTIASNMLLNEDLASDAPS
jgi:uncharacterized protein DUF6791/ThiF family protein